MVEAYESAVEELKREKETLLAAAALLELGTVHFHQQESRSGNLLLCLVPVVVLWCVALHTTGPRGRRGAACSLTPERELLSVFITQSLATVEGWCQCSTIIPM